MQTPIAVWCAVRQAILINKREGEEKGFRECCKSVAERLGVDVKQVEVIAATYSECFYKKFTDDVVEKI